MDEVEDFLAHFGVKGMKWGERKTTSTGPSRKPSKETVKKAANKIGWGSLGPAAVIAGLGPPISLAIGLSAAVLSEPAVRKAIANSSKASANLMKDIGQTKVSAMREARELKKDVTGKLEPTLAIGRH